MLNLQDLKMTDSEKNNGWKIQHHENDGPNRRAENCKIIKRRRNAMQSAERSRHQAMNRQV